MLQQLWDLLEGALFFACLVVGSAGVVRYIEWSIGERDHLWKS